MSLHSIAAYLRYKWKAQNRHGVHSPHAYALVEDVLEHRADIKYSPRPFPITIPQRYHDLLARIAAYYKYERIIAIPTKQAEGTYDMVLMSDADPAQWQQVFHQHFCLLHNNSMVVIPNIHATAAHTAAWDALCADARVRMSIDLYKIGLLLFGQEFKEQQHFVLKY